MYVDIRYIQYWGSVKAIKLRVKIKMNTTTKSVGDLFTV